MAEYQRILSYLYHYDKKNKKDCKGFIKAEQKRSGLKLTIQIEDDRIMEDMALDLCFYQKRGEKWKMERLDRLKTGQHQEETVLFYPAEKLPEGFDIQKQYGVLLYYQDSFYYGSVWIGEEIPIDELISTYKEEKNQEEPLSAREEKTAKEEKENIIEKEKNIEEQKDEAGNDLEEFLNSKMPEEIGNFSKEMNEKYENLEKEDPEIISDEELGFDRMKRDFDGMENMEETGRSENVENPNETEEAEELNTAENRDEFSEIRKQAQAMDNIFNPAFRFGYKISVNQLDIFNPEAKSLSDNQFLVKGYGRYHHLLAGKVMYAGEERCCVGVPGIYENRERYMAEIYQFPVFLPLTENRIKTGGFGYWLHLLQE